MFANPKFSGACAALIGVALGAMTTGTWAVSADVAKKCAALTAKAYPPRVIGNPAAGSAKGTGAAEQQYYQKCLAHGGNVDGSTDQQGK